MSENFTSKLKKSFKKIVSNPVVIIYLVAVLIYLPRFLPNLNDISPWDETYYIMSGKRMLEGQPPTLAYGPLLSFFYMLCYLPFINSPFWLIHVNSLGRFILFSLLFVGTWQVGRAMKKYYSPLILIAFLFLTPLLTDNFEYSADMLFGMLSAMAFARAVRFLGKQDIEHVWWASFWLGLGMLTRGDALIIFVALLVFVVIMGWKAHAWWRLILAMLIPFVALSAGYVLFRGVLTGDFDTGISTRSYVAFEQGQEVDMRNTPGRFGGPTDSFYLARKLFGTPEENNYSVFKAISRNPEAYQRRLLAVMDWLPGFFLTAYYRPFTVFIALLALRGVVALVKQKKIPLVVLHLIWILPLSAGIARTLVRVGYYRLFFFVMFSLAAIGLKALLDHLRPGWESLGWAVVMLGFFMVSFPVDQIGIRLGMTVFLGWLALAYWLSGRADRIPHWRQLALLLLLAAGFLIKGDFHIIQPRVLGQIPQEEASLVLREVTEPEDYVLTSNSATVFLASRNVANFSSSDIPDFPDSESFIIWMREQDFRAIYLDSESPKELWDFTFEQSGEALTRVYASDSGEAYIFLLDDER